MNKVQEKNRPKQIVLETSIGDFLTTIYDSALEEIGDVHMATRLALKTLVRKVRLERNHHLRKHQVVVVGSTER